MVTIVVLVILAFIGYLVSLRLHPFRRCRWCAGSGKHFGAVFIHAHRPCRRCGGSGRRERYGRRFAGGTSN